jgi:cytoskeletal protein RodZ
VGTLDTVQQEQLKAIGTYLSDVRQEQARSLEEIAAKTYIPLRLLKALEAGQEKPLPEPVFIQGFIRRYADALGLDGIDLSQKFPVHVTPLPMAPAATATSREPRMRNTVESSYAPVQVEEYEPPRRSPTAARSTSFLPYLAAAGLLVLGGIALGVVRSISQRSDVVPQSSVVLPKQPVPTVESSPAAPQIASPSPKPLVSPSAVVRAASPSPVAASPAASPAVSASPTGSNATTNAPVSVAVSLTGESWVQVMVDGEIKAEGILPKGTRQNWAGQREITIVAGNAGAVSVAQNGGAAKAMGSAGDVAEVRFTPKSN